ncbi:HpcH/HpaI aldolase/citrate lyase family protein [Streptomyces sp. NBC_01429]|uniref:HpcH/HpaI aldolase/citrate lyase family protein n=1 Tax=Streptomyces sp. NBC_01429 TaxID=2903862 RepID=UPI002E2D4043|nr:aldolase/citrate lyase family protein [Streptomyces sp. NBC_01429]
MTGQAPGAARSLLFVPAGDERLLAKAHLRGAHGLVLDLEDAVPESGKEAARRALPGHIDRLAAEGQYLVVRTGSVREEWEKDLRAALRPGLRAVMLPKAEHPEQLAGMAAFLDAAERERGLPEGAVGLIALIESPAALFALPALAKAPRVRALAFGSEDFSLALGVAPTPSVLTEPCRWIALAASAAGIGSFALPLSLAVLDRPDALAEAARRARGLGVTGALCVHPKQVAAVNAAWAPDDTEIGWARRVTAAWDTAGRGGPAPGVIRVDGQMVDAPVLRRARGLLAAIPAGEHPENTDPGGGR